jgi:hypothetical protein
MVSMKQKPLPFHPSQLTTQDERLQFVVAFAQLDLDALSAGDWLNLRETLARFLYLMPGLGTPSKPITALAVDVAGGRADLFQPRLSFGMLGIPTEAASLDPASQLDPASLLAAWSAEDVRTLQADTLAWLQSLTAFPVPGEGFPPHRLPLAGEVLLGPSGVRPVQVIAPLRMLFFWYLFWLLLAEPPDRIQRCPECATIFFRVKKQAYCSRTCGNRATQRRWRERHEVSAPTAE